MSFEKTKSSLYKAADKLISHSFKQDVVNFWNIVSSPKRLIAWYESENIPMWKKTLYTALAVLTLALVVAFHWTAIATGSIVIAIVLITKFILIVVLKKGGAFLLFKLGGAIFWGKMVYSFVLKPVFMIAYGGSRIYRAFKYRIPERSTYCFDSSVTMTYGNNAPCNGKFYLLPDNLKGLHIQELDTGKKIKVRFSSLRIFIDEFVNKSIKVWWYGVAHWVWGLITRREGVELWNWEAVKQGMADLFSIVTSVTDVEDKYSPRFIDTANINYLGFCQKLSVDNPGATLDKIIMPGESRLVKIVHFKKRGVTELHFLAQWTDLLSFYKIHAKDSKWWELHKNISFCKPLKKTKTYKVAVING